MRTSYTARYPRRSHQRRSAVVRVPVGFGRPRDALIGRANQPVASDQPVEIRVTGSSMTSPDHLINGEAAQPWQRAR